MISSSQTKSIFWEGLSATWMMTKVNNPMADTQANRLINLVRQTNLENLLEVLLSPFEVKKSSIEEIGVGDILMLPSKSLE